MLNSKGLGVDIGLTDNFLDNNIPILKDLAGLFDPEVNCWHCLCRDVNQPGFLFMAVSQL